MNLTPKTLEEIADEDQRADAAKFAASIGGSGGAVSALSLALRAISNGFAAFAPCEMNGQPCTALVAHMDEGDGVRIFPLLVFVDGHKGGSVAPILGGADIGEACTLVTTPPLVELAPEAFAHLDVPEAVAALIAKALLGNKGDDDHDGNAVH